MKPFDWAKGHPKEPGNGTLICMTMTNGDGKLETHYCKNIYKFLCEKGDENALKEEVTTPSTGNGMVSGEETSKGQEIYPDEDGMTEPIEHGKFKT